MSLSAGKMLSHYRLVEQIGRGGMGVVWKAYDTSLHRHVAIKVLPGEFVSNEAHRQRFIREARLAANVSHPNIATVHEVAESDGTAFIVMELVKGRTLRDLIRSKNLDVRKALAIAVQVADGLAQAHRHKVVHRDLKPENVMVEKEGHVRLLDFGLAKLLEERESASRVSPSRATTITGELTREGKVLGTPAYMSPEQARGAELDFRSDLFSFGITLYEMLTGLQPFRGPTPMDTLSLIMTADAVPASRINSEVPQELDRILAKCLQKAPEERYQDTRDLLVDLRQLKRETESQPVLRVPTPSTIPIARRWPRLILLAGIGGGLILIALLMARDWVYRGGKQSAARSEPVQTQLTTNPLGRPIYFACISPDGNYLTYTNDKGLYLRSIATGDVRDLKVPDGTNLPYGSWFPDGSRLLVTTYDGKESTLWILSILTGELRKLRAKASDGMVSPDGSHIAFFADEFDRPEIWVMDVGGGNARRIVAPEENEFLSWWLLWSPDGRRIAFRRQTRPPEGGAFNSIETQDLEGGSPSVVLPPLAHVYPGIHGVWIADGRIIFTKTEGPKRPHDGNFWEIRVDTATGQPLSEPRRLTAYAGDFFYDLSATRDGETVAFVKWHQNADIFVSERSIDGLHLEPPRRITFDTRNDFIGDWFPDSQAVLFGSERRGTRDLFKVDLQSRKVQTIHESPNLELNPRLTPDGRWVLYAEVPRTEYSLQRFTNSSNLMRLALADGTPEKVMEVSRRDSFDCGSRVGTSCVFGEAGETSLALFSLDPISGKGKLVHEFDIEVRSFPGVIVSPDGTRVAVVAHRKGIIDVLNLKTGESREIKMERLAGGVPYVFDWTADGKGFYGSAGVSSTILRINSEGMVQEVGKVEGAIRLTGCSPSPDGRHLAIGAMFRDSTVWKIEGI